MDWSGNNAFWILGILDLRILSAVSTSAKNIALQYIIACSAQLNLIPLPPLDGGRIAVSLLPNHLAYKYAQIERYGFLILIILLMTHILDLIIFPLIQISQSLILWIFA